MDIRFGKINLIIWIFWYIKFCGIDVVYLREKYSVQFEPKRQEEWDSWDKDTYWGIYRNNTNCSCGIEACEIIDEVSEIILEFIM